MIMDGSVGTFFLIMTCWWRHIHLDHISLVNTYRKSCEDKYVTSVLLKKCLQNRQIRDQNLSSCNNLWNNFFIVLMFKYSCETKDRTCLIYKKIVWTSNDKIRKLWNNFDAYAPPHLKTLQASMWKMFRAIDCVSFVT